MTETHFNINDLFDAPETPAPKVSVDPPQKDDALSRIFAAFDAENAAEKAETNTAIVLDSSALNDPKMFAGFGATLLLASDNAAADEQLIPAARALYGVDRSGYGSWKVAAIEEYMRSIEGAGKLIWVSSSVSNLLPIGITEGDLLDEILTEMGVDFQLVTIVNGVPDADQWATAIEGLGNGQEHPQKPREQEQIETVNTEKVVRLLRPLNPSQSSKSSGC